MDEKEYHGPIPYTPGPRQAKVEAHIPCSVCGDTVRHGVWHDKKFFCDFCNTSRALATPPFEGRKDDALKPRHDLIAPELPDYVARVLTFGAEKYGERNWEKGMKWHRPFAALMRHIWAWWSGECYDPETGLPHLAHAACCVMFLLAYEERNIGEDDRPKNESTSRG